MGMALAVTFAAPVVAGSAPITGITPAFDYFSAPQVIYTERTAENPRAPANPPTTLGYSFTLDMPSTVNALGYWSDGNLVSEQVGIWDSLGNPITSTIVNFDATLLSEVGGYFYTLLTTPVVLEAGKTYVIGGSISEGGKFPGFLSGLDPAPGYTAFASRESLGGGFTFPVNEYPFDPEGFGPQSIALVNFSFSHVSAVPEPATWAMMLLGFGVVGTSIRRRRKMLATA